MKVYNNIFIEWFVWTFFKKSYFKKWLEWNPDNFVLEKDGNILFFVDMTYFYFKRIKDKKIKKIMDKIIKES